MRSKRLRVFKFDRSRHPAAPRAGLQKAASGWRDRTSELIAAGRSVLLNALLLVGSIVLALTFLQELGTQSISIAPVSLPKSFEDRGLTPQVMAARVGAQMQRIDREAKTQMPRPPFVGFGEQLDFVIPGQQFSFRTIVNYLKNIFGTSDTLIGIDVVQDPSGMSVSVRIRGGPRNGTSGTMPVGATDSADTLVREVAEQTMRIAQPYVYASYQMAMAQATCSTLACRLDSAHELLETAIAEAKDDERFWALLGQSDAFKREARHPEQVSSSRAATNLRKGSSLAWETYGSALYDSGKYREALDAFKTALSLERTARTLYHVGTTLEKLDQHQKAALYLSKAVRLDPRLVEARIALGDVLSVIPGREDDAKRQYESAIAHDPKQPSAHAGLGELHASHNRWMESAAAYREAAMLAPANAEYQARWGWVLLKVANPTQAAIAYRRAVDAAPDEPICYAGLGEALFQSGAYREALHRFRYAAVLAPDESDEFARKVHERIDLAASSAKAVD